MMLINVLFLLSKRELWKKKTKKKRLFNITLKKLKKKQNMLLNKDALKMKKKKKLLDLENYKKKLRIDKLSLMP